MPPCVSLTNELPDPAARRDKERWERCQERATSISRAIATQPHTHTPYDSLSAPADL